MYQTNHGVMTQDSLTCQCQEGVQMPTSFCQIAVHIIFGTKGRMPCLTDAIYPYIQTLISDMKGVPIRINGTCDHVHILCFLSKEVKFSDFVRTIKANSSRWFKDINNQMAWQTGYAAYGVSKTNIPVVKQYIGNQKEHHKRLTFAEEMKKYLAEEDGMDVWNEWFS
jgi:REP element-mobilizing transposase RayT